MGIGEPASQGRLFPDPPVTHSVPLIPEGPQITLERRNRRRKKWQTTIIFDLQAKNIEAEV